MCLQHRSAYYAAKYVLPALVSWPHAVGDEEGHAARVVGDYAQHAICGFGVSQGDARVLHCLLEDGCVEVSVVEVENILYRGGGPFQSHAGVDASLTQGHEGLVFQLLVLVEDEVPDLEEARISLVAAGTVLRVLGRVAPGGLYQFSLLGRPKILSSGTPTPIQYSFASTSSGASSSPSKIVTHRRSGSMPSSSVTKAHAHPMASFLK